MCWKRKMGHGIGNNAGNSINNYYGKEDQKTNEA